MTNGKQRHIVHAGIGAGEVAQVFKTCSNDSGRAARGLTANQIRHAINAVFAIAAAGFREAIGEQEEQVSAAQLQSPADGRR